jgi:hypothetical protein
VVRNLWRLSLVAHDPDDDARSVRIHALAHRAGREQVPPSAVDVVVRVAADALTALWPSVGAGTPLGQVLRANATMLVHHRSAALWGPERHPLLVQLGSGLIASGMTTSAVMYLDELTKEAVRRLGPFDPFTLTSLAPDRRLPPKPSSLRCSMRARGCSVLSIPTRWSAPVKSRGGTEWPAIRQVPSSCSTRCVLPGVAYSALNTRTRCGRATASRAGRGSQVT